MDVSKACILPITEEPMKGCKEAAYSYLQDRFTQIRTFSSPRLLSPGSSRSYSLGDCLCHFPGVCFPRAGGLWVSCSENLLFCFNLASVILVQSGSLLLSYPIPQALLWPLCDCPLTKLVRAGEGPGKGNVPGLFRVQVTDIYSGWGRPTTI